MLLPGLDGTGELFAPFIASLANNLTSIVCVYPEDANMQYRDYLEFASSVCPIDEPYLVLGESFSGPIAMEIAATSPTMLKGLILVNTFATCPRRRLVRLLRAIPGRTLTNPPAVFLSYLLRKRESTICTKALIGPVLKSLSVPVVRSRLLILEQTDVRVAGANINTPTCLIQSIDDLAVPAKNRKELLSLLRNPVVHNLEGNHFGLQTYPRKAARIVSEFHIELFERPCDEV